MGQAQAIRQPDGQVLYKDELGNYWVNTPQGPVKLSSNTATPSMPSGSMPVSIPGLIAKATGAGAAKATQSLLSSSNPEAVSAALGSGGGLEGMSLGGSSLGAGMTPVNAEVASSILGPGTSVTAPMTSATGTIGSQAPVVGMGGTPPAAGIGAYALPAAGALIGGAMLRQGYRKRNPLTGAVGGGLGSAGLIGGLQAAGMLGPLGVPGLALAIGGGALLGGLGGLLKKKKKTDVEQKRYRAMIESGLLPKEWVAPQLLEDTKGNDQPIREEEFTAPTLAGFAALPEKLGSAYAMVDQPTREKVAQLFINKPGSFREHHGTVDLNWTPELEQAAKNLLTEQLKKQSQGQRRR